MSAVPNPPRAFAAPVAQAIPHDLGGPLGVEGPHPEATTPAGVAQRLVLVHGFTQNRRCWDPVDALLARRHQVVRVDAPGHGDAAALALDLPTAGATYADALGPAAWIGYSMGGRLALHAAVMRPDLVRGLVLVGASPGISDATERTQRRQADEALADEIERIGTAAFIDRWLANPLFAGLGPDNDHRTERLANDPGGLATSLRLAGTGAQEPLWDQLAAITCPVLLVTGADDAKFAAIADAMAPRFGGPCTTVTIAGAGHSVHLEQPGAFVAAVEAWLDGALPPGPTGGQAAGTP